MLTDLNIISHFSCLAKDQMLAELHDLLYDLYHRRKLERLSNLEFSASLDNVALYFPSLEPASFQAFDKALQVWNLLPFTDRELLLKIFKHLLHDSLRVNEDISPILIFCKIFTRHFVPVIVKYTPDFMAT
jgi:hypothetical protein